MVLNLLNKLEHNYFNLKRRQKKESTKVSQTFITKEPWELTSYLPEPWLHCTPKS